MQSPSCSTPRPLLATVDGERLAADPARTVTGEEQHAMGDVPRRAQASECNVVQQGLLAGRASGTVLGKNIRRKDAELGIVVISTLGRNLS